MKRLLAAMTAASAVLLGGVATAQPAAAAAADCRITDYRPRAVVVGLSPVTKKFALMTDCPGWVDSWYLDVTPWWGPNVTDTSPYDTVNPTWLSNSFAGRKYGATASAWFEDPDDWTDYSVYERTFAYSFVVRRATAISSFNASPEPVAKGKPITIKGLLRSANWDQEKYLPLRYASVRVQFKRAGTTTWSTVKTVKSSSTGWVSTTVTASYDGTWRLNYGGGSAFGSRVSGGDYVDVR
jgi:hypothetical protein